jgi:HD superfamily phosphohydrolase YqeK
MTEELLQKLVAQYRVPVHIQRHMKKVAAAALYLGQKIHQSGQPINLIVLRQAALLHDVLKLCDFKELDIENFEQTVTAEDIHFWTALMKSCRHVGHIEAAYNMLKEIGEDEIATIVRKHRFEGLIDQRDKPKTWEEKLVYYADKRVRHDQIVSIAERLEDGRKRYFPDGNLPPDDHLVEKALYKLEKEICSKAGVKPGDINEKNVEPFLEK